MKKTLFSVVVLVTGMISGGSLLADPYVVAGHGGESHAGPSGRGAVVARGGGVAGHAPSSASHVAVPTARVSSNRPVYEERSGYPAAGTYTMNGRMAARYDGGSSQSARTAASSNRAAAGSYAGAARTGNRFGYTGNGSAQRTSVSPRQHPNWVQGRNYYWNHRHYRWYNGGWIIVDGSVWDDGSSYYYAPEETEAPADVDYAPDQAAPQQVSDGGSAIYADVQEALTQQGYYQGPVDGVLGPNTRQAIAAFESDHGLVPNGHVNELLIESLGLE